jgi:hypothetical protein
MWLLRRVSPRSLSGIRECSVRLAWQVRDKSDAPVEQTPPDVPEKDITSESDKDKKLSAKEMVLRFEQHLLDLSAQQKKAYQEVQPAPRFRDMGDIVRETRKHAHRPAFAPDMMHDDKSNIIVQERDKLNARIALINSSQSLIVLRSRMQDFFRDCQLTLEKLGEEILSAPPLTAITLASTKELLERPLPINGWDMILEAGIRTAARFGDINVAEAFLEQAKRMKIIIYVRTATIRIYHAMMEASWNLSHDADRVLFWLDEAKLMGFAMDKSTLDLLRRMRDDAIQQERDAISLQPTDADQLEDSPFNSLFPEHTQTPSEAFDKVIKTLQRDLNKASSNHRHRFPFHYSTTQTSEITF